MTEEHDCMEHKNSELQFICPVCHARWRRGLITGRWKNLGIAPFRKSVSDNDIVKVANKLPKTKKK